MLIEDELKLNIEYELDSEIKYIKINDNNISYQIQLLSNDMYKQQGFNSYIYTDNPKTTALDISKSLDSNLVSIDFNDLMNITNNKSLNHYRISLFGLLDNENIKEFIESLNINILNKKGLVIIYGNNILSLKQIDEIMSYFKTNKDIYYTCPLDNNLGDNEVVLSLLIER